MQRSLHTSWSFVAGLLLLCACALPLSAQVPTAVPPNVFLDCNARSCSSDHIRTEIRFVNWMRDRTDADVYVIVTSESTGGGGDSYRLSTRGHGRFDGDSAEIRFSVPTGSTDAERRDVLTNRLALALVRYAALTDAAAQITIGGSDDAADETAAAVDDPWNHWVFSAAGSAQIDGESREQEREFELSLEAQRVTEDWKLEFEVEGQYDELELRLTDRTVNSVRRDFEADALVVHSLARLWSAGMSAATGTSTFENQDLYGRLAAVLEYSFFPYEDFSRRQMTLRYSIGARYFDYEAPTIYDRTTEQRADHELALNVNFRQPWGYASAEVSGSHYLHNVRRHSLESRLNFNIRLLRGFSLDVSANYERVRDQIYIPKGDATDEEVLLRRRALETGYRYYSAIGLRYTFGSVYNSIVNPRVGN
jgi:hypothetical protein